MSDSRTSARVHALWARFGMVILGVVVVHAAVTAGLRLAPAVHALLAVPDGPTDLLIRTDEVRRWFAGVTIYRDAHSANYPPASYALLWPLLGWLADGPTRILFGMSTLLAAATVGVVAARASGVSSWTARAFLAVFVLPLGATQITVWLGQLGLHVVACLLAATWLLFGVAARTSGERSAPAAAGLTEAAAGLLLAWSLVKPTLSLPVVVALLVVAGRWRPVAWTAAVYGVATLLAAAFQDASALDLVIMWLGREDIMNLPLGSVNTYLWLHWLGFEGSMLVASFMWLAALAAWCLFRRNADPWVLLGIAGLVGRLWIHHRAFDDVLLMLPVVALARIAIREREQAGWVSIAAGVSIAAIYGLGHAPWSYLSGASFGPWLATEVGRSLAWTATLGFLVWYSSGARAARARGALDA